MTDTVRSTAAIRADFPALRRVHHGRPVAFFDGPGGTQVPQVVIDAMADYLAHHNANTHWNYPSSHETDEIIAAGRAAAADFLNAGPDEMVFGPNMTTLTFHLARGLARDFAAGDEIVTTELDHHGNVGPWQAAARDRGLVVRRVPFRLADGTLDLDQVIGAIGPKTRVVAIGGASNALGTITDVAPVCRAARDRGALSFVDAVHSAAHVLPDVAALGCDFLACSPYKFHGPHHGLLYGRSERLRAVAIPKLDPAPDAIPERLETGTQSHEAIAGTRAAIDYLASLAPGEGRRGALAAAYAGLHRRSMALFRGLWDGLAAIPGVRLFGLPPDGPRTPTVGFVVAGRPSSVVARRLAERGLWLSHGDFYAATVVERLGLGDEGMVRAGLACYNTAEDVERLVGEVAAIART